MSLCTFKQDQYHMTGTLYLVVKEAMIDGEKDTNKLSNYSFLY